MRLVVLTTLAIGGVWGIFPDDPGVHITEIANAVLDEELDLKKEQIIKLNNAYFMPTILYGLPQHWLVAQDLFNFREVPMTMTQVAQPSESWNNRLLWSKSLKLPFTSFQAATGGAKTTNNPVIQAIRSGNSLKNHPPETNIIGGFHWDEYFPTSTSIDVTLPDGKIHTFSAKSRPKDFAGTTQQETPCDNTNAQITGVEPLRGGTTYGFDYVLESYSKPTQDLYRNCLPEDRKPGPVFSCKGAACHAHSKGPFMGSFSVGDFASAFCEGFLCGSFSMGRYSAYACGRAVKPIEYKDNNDQSYGKGFIAGDKIEDGFLTLFDKQVPKSFMCGYECIGPACAQHCNGILCGAYCEGAMCASGCTDTLCGAFCVGPFCAAGCSGTLCGFGARNHVADPYKEECSDIPVSYCLTWSVVIGLHCNLVKVDTKILCVEHTVNKENLLMDLLIDAQLEPKCDVVGNAEEDPDCLRKNDELGLDDVDEPGTNLNKILNAINPDRRLIPNKKVVDPTVGIVTTTITIALLFVASLDESARQSVDSQVGTSFEMKPLGTTVF